MSSDNDHLNIDNLPSDVIRKIIRVGQESIEEMRMISRRWNTLAVDHFTYRKHLPPLTSINWRFEPCGEEYFTFSIEISNNLVNYFEVPKQLITDYETESVFVGVDRKYRKVKKQEWFSRRLGRLISRCSHIQNLEMDAMNFDKNEFQFDHIRSVLADVTVHQLTCNTFHNMSHATVGTFAANILNLIRALSVRRLVLPLAAFHRQPTVIAHSYFIFICKTVAKTANLVDSIDIIAEDWFNDGDEPTVKEHWTTIADALSKQANVDVTFVMKKEKLLHVDALKMYITVTARKQIDE